MKNKKVSIIILNWNGWEDTIECLESLYKIKYDNYDVIIVDNASENDSINKIREYAAGNIKINSNFTYYETKNKPIEILEYFKDDYDKKTLKKDEFNKLSPNRKLTIIKCDRNYGFPEGCNIGMRYALNQGTDYLLLLNNDTVVDENFLSELVDFAETDSSIGILGSKIYYYHNPEYMQAAGGRIRWYLGEIKTYGGGELDKGQYDEIAERDYVYGTSLLLRKEVLNKISFMDPSFFFGVEEYDYCTRAKKAGFKIFYVPSSGVWHKAGASSSKLSKHPDTLKIIKKTGGSHKYKYYYMIFQKHGPKLFYVFPFLIYMAQTTLSMNFFKLLLKRDFKTIKLGIVKRL
jgi:GT2 family glycosyltransferase